MPPIARLWRTLALGGGFPTCAEGGVATSTRNIGDDVLVEVTPPGGVAPTYSVDISSHTISVIPARTRRAAP